MQEISLRLAQAKQEVRGFSIDFFTFSKGILEVLEDTTGI
jgi:hypothetical protein